MNSQHSRINQAVNIITGCSVGVFLGHAAYVFADFRRHPDWYAAQSAPWYSSILTYGIFTIAVLAAALLVKAVIRRRKPKK